MRTITACNPSVFAQPNCSELPHLAGSNVTGLIRPCPANHRALSLSGPVLMLS